MRLIDAETLSAGIALHRQPADHQWAVGYNAGLDRALYSIAYAKTIIPPPNDPLTFEELRGMDGEPVWISYFAGGLDVCMLVDTEHEICRDAHGGFAVFENLGNTWMAYRRKPEEEAASPGWADHLKARFERTE